MTFQEVVAELRSKFPKADLSPSVLHGECARRAVGVLFAKGRGGMYVGRDADGTEVMVYFNDTARLICCTELPPARNADDE